MRQVIGLAAVLAQAAFAQSDLQIRNAIHRALPPLQSSAANFVAARACVSCHHNVLPVLLFHMAQDRGFEIDPEVLKAVEEKTFRGLRSSQALDDAIQAATLNDPTPDESYLLMAAHAAGLPPDLITGVYARRLARWQRDGHWVTSDFRPPHSSSVFTATATAVRAIRLYMPGELQAERDACLARARQWLASTPPASTEDASFRLLGLVWAGGKPEETNLARRDLLALQKAGGGWPELRSYPADAYSTGEALYALRQAGLGPSDAAWRRGLTFLLSTQAPDGTWRVHTRMLSPAEVSPPYFTTGFPYGKDEFLSYAGSCWAVMALLAAAPEAAPPKPTPPPPPAKAPSWMRTALFGSAAQLAALLDSGLDARAKTDRGTALLMMVAPDPDKIRMLLSRGADPSPGAVAIAAAYRGTADSIRALLDAGAGIPASALVFASMTGDLQIVNLLLAHGADPSASWRGNTPLSQAVTFGYPDVALALIDAGASVAMRESSGINLLHWAAIANRAALIPVLAAAGVPVNDQDMFGFTPLMYAATLDFGDTDTAKALLRAGANPAIRNHDRRTARQQARYFGHAQIEAALR
ncbi:MAG TPA: ankyrin repeat domain-containing protein [Bryobacteraceae bacterium]|nr:ankyrin repeat domain-containing protein [Bryobacteraceae bacterium]